MKPTSILIKDTTKEDRIRIGRAESVWWSL